MKRFLSQNQLLPLRLFYTNPEKSFYMREIGRILGKKPGVFQRTLNGLVEDGLLLSEYRGHARFFQANAGYPLYPELKKIVEKTAGVEGTLRNLCRRIKGLKLALLYGSFARGKERKDSDIDLLVVGNPRIEDQLLRQIPRLEKEFQREINYRLYSDKEYREKRAGQVMDDEPEWGATINETFSFMNRTFLEQPRRPKAPSRPLPNCFLLSRISSGKKIPSFTSNSINPGRNNRGSLSLKKRAEKFIRTSFSSTPATPCRMRNRKIKKSA